MDFKDRFEHLRTVHFSLLVTCLGLLVVSTTSQDRTIAAAEEQLRALRSVVTSWNSLDFDATINQQAKASTLPQPTDRSVRASDGDLYAVDFATPSWAPPVDEKCSPWLYDSMIRRVPRTLSDVREIWDCLHTANVVAIPFAFSADYAIVDGKKALVQTRAPTGTKHLHCDFVRNDEDQRAAIRQVFSLSPEFSFVGTIYSAKGSKDKIVIPVEKSRFITIDLVEPLRQLEPFFVSDSGDYRKSFPELNDLTNDYADLTFDKLTAILASQRKHSAQTFEAFSVKFPSEAIARWGIVLILGIQLYFALHMAAIRLTPDVETTTAWLPLYPAVLPQTVFAATFTLLPVFTICAVGHVGTISSNPSVDKWLVLIAVVASALLGFETLLLFAKYFPGPVPQFLTRLHASRRSNAVDSED